VSKFIVIEGIDGAGKGTHTRRLAEVLQENSHDVSSFSFPAYDTTRFGKLVGEYLNGKYGNDLDKFPELVAILFGLDRFERKDVLSEHIATKDFVLCDRYCSSNVAYGCAKLPEDRKEEYANFLTWLDYQLFSMPVPDLVIYLDIPVELAAQLIAKKQKRCYTDKTEDLHEADHEYLSKVRSNYYSLVPEISRYRNWTTIDVGKDGELRDEDSVFEDILNAAQSFGNENK
jgi:dTMP kinase